MESLSHRGGFWRQTPATALLRPDPLLSGLCRRVAHHPPGFPLGRYPLRIEHTTLKLAEYQHSADEASEIEAFRAHQQAAFDAERERWAANGQAHFDSSEVLVTDGEDAPLAPGQAGIDSPVSGNLWQVNVEVGNTVREGDVLVVLESMKMEIPLVATRDGVVSVRVQPGSSVRAGQCGGPEKTA